eukprot:CAMPEP_0198142356 /NCGR_PEP_ID=MMETSP1443-20131203/5160_1 /TAXON_ID=186043 /ORGANISM="Entomoneis sp., Strain CCMP2396" /LENGTH=441 /DNA_ID=CAMNT_0043805337 /DNA_START=241 /DNA_END=1563 /DNA_ORIENTATION=+
MRALNFLILLSFQCCFLATSAFTAHRQRYNFPRANNIIYRQQHQHQHSISNVASPVALAIRQACLFSSAADDEQPTKDISPSQYSPMKRKDVSLSQRSAAKGAGDTYKHVHTPAEARSHQLYTFLRVSIPSVVIGLLATLLFPALALSLCTLISDAGVFTVLSTDSSQFVQNFLSVASLLFSMLVGQTYYFMYQQQENLYYALFNEVTEAKSLLEQVALVCQGRSMYRKCLDNISNYVKNDLKQLQADPAVLLSARPSEDPLESIMYMTSVGVPSTVYETVRSLRQARAGRLGALQRKIPQAHMWLLWVLASIELVSFPLLGAGTQVIGGYNILTVEGILFGVMTAGIVLTLRVVGELWRPAGGAYNVDSVLTTMVMGLEEELEARMAGKAVFASNSSPSAAREAMPTNGEVRREPKSSLQIKQQGGNIVDAIKLISRFLW